MRLEIVSLNALGPVEESKCYSQRVDLVILPPTPTPNSHTISSSCET